MPDTKKGWQKYFYKIWICPRLMLVADKMILRFKVVPFISHSIGEKKTEFSTDLDWVIK